MGSVPPRPHNTSVTRVQISNSILVGEAVLASGVMPSGPKTVKGAQSYPNYVSRLLLDGVPVFHKIITPAYVLFRSGPVAIYYSQRWTRARSECLP